MMREAIVTLSALRKGNTTPDILTFHWFVVEDNGTEILLAENRDLDEAVVAKKENVLSISYLED